MNTEHALHMPVHNEEQKNQTVLFGFWMYLMSDCLLFASLFATYAVLHTSTFGGPTGGALFSMPFVLAETVILLTSSFVCGLALLFAYRGLKNRSLLFFGLTLILGLTFLGLELSEFSRLAAEGNSWHRSAFLSSFFALVGTHGLHVTLGSLWMVVLMVHVWLKGLSDTTVRRLTCLTLFWHFLDVIWIFIFTVVYILGII